MIKVDAAAPVHYHCESAHQGCYYIDCPHKTCMAELEKTKLLLGQMYIKVVSGALRWCDDPLKHDKTCNCAEFNWVNEVKGVIKT